MADVGLSGGDPPYALSQDVDGKAVASACVSECCGGECVLYWRADSCPLPAVVPGNCGPIDPATITIWVRVGATCNTSDGEVISPGIVVVVSGLCYLVMAEIRHRLNFPGESCSSQYDNIPANATVIDDLILACEPDGCNAPRCIAARVGYAQAEACGPSQIPWYFCKALLTSDCVYKPMPSEFVPGTDMPNSDSQLVCHAFKASAPNLTFVPPEDRIADPNPTGPGSNYRSCCECNRGGTLAEQCVWTSQDTDAGNNPISPRLECCCGSEEDAAASVVTIQTYTYEQISPGGRILVELVGTASGLVNEVIPATLRQRVYNPDGSGPISDVTFPGDFFIPLCGPLLLPVINDVGNPYTILASEYDCNSASATFQRGDPATLYEKYTWGYSKTPPTIAAPCLGGCSSSAMRAESAEIVRWLGIDWYGTPYPIRVWNWLTGKSKKEAGCGCIKSLKDRVRTI